MGRKLDGEWVLLNLKSGVYYGLNETGSLIWDSLAESKNFQEIIDRLQKNFPLGRPKLETDLRHFFKALAKEGLIERDALPA